MIGPSGWNAETYINPAMLDKQLIKRYENVRGAVELLDQWILVPDLKLLPKLQVLAKELQKIAALPHGQKLFRGFDPSSPYQDTMGLSKKGFLWNRVKKYDVGDGFGYEVKNPISFATDELIAREFGSTVVQLITIPDNYIWITDELSYLVCQHRNIEPVSQKEVIVLPPDQLQLKVVRK